MCSIRSSQVPYPLEEAHRLLSCRAFTCQPSLPATSSCRWTTWPNRWALRRATSHRRFGRQESTKDSGTGSRWTCGPTRCTTRSEERRVGKECRSRGSPYHLKKKNYTSESHITRDI